ncbi:SDR family NAD(P)-dependent oxidoreductase [Chloroflexota bacterium]
MKLENRVAIVTGAASGIGQAIARRLAQEGASVVIGDINLEGAQKTADELRASGFKALAAKVDVSRLEEASNADPKPFVWTASVETILSKVKRANEVLETLH